MKTREVENRELYGGKRGNEEYGLLIRKRKKERKKDSRRKDQRKNISVPSDGRRDGKEEERKDERILVFHKKTPSE